MKCPACGCELCDVCGECHFTHSKEEEIPA